MIRKILTTLPFLAAILLANLVTSRFGMVPVGFGLVATAGTYFAGLTFIIRDHLHDRLGRRWVLAAIVVGAVLSFALSAPFIAVASGIAFLLSEVADMLIYEPLRKQGYIRAAVASNVVGSFLDTVIFLAIAGFPIWSSVPGQMVGKLFVTAVFVLAVAMFRRVDQGRAVLA